MASTTYATYEDVQARMNKTLTSSEQALCNTLLGDAAVMIDNYNSKASADAKKIVSCRMVIRAMSVDDTIPYGSIQGTMTAGNYSQTFQMPSNGSVGELYLSKTDKDLLGGHGNSIGSYSPVQELAPQPVIPVIDEGN